MPNLARRAATFSASVGSGKQALVQMFYNRKGAQSTLDYMSPFEYERQKVNNDETFCH
jgi:hypothetical protein